MKKIIITLLLILIIGLMLGCTEKNDQGVIVNEEGKVFIDDEQIDPNTELLENKTFINTINFNGCNLLPLDKVGKAKAITSNYRLFDQISSTCSYYETPLIDKYDIRDLPEFIVSITKWDNAPLDSFGLDPDYFIAQPQIGKNVYKSGTDMSYYFERQDGGTDIITIRSTAMAFGGEEFTKEMELKIEKFMPIIIENYKNNTHIIPERPITTLLPNLVDEADLQKYNLPPPGTSSSFKGDDFESEGYIFSLGFKITITQCDSKCQTEFNNLDLNPELGPNTSLSESHYESSNTTFLTFYSLKDNKKLEILWSGKDQMEANNTKAFAKTIISKFQNN